MPEARDWVLQAAGAATTELAGGFFIRRGASPMPAAESGRVLSRRVADGKENIPPWAVTRRRKSPLPKWYPRTPLRDITFILNALERRRSHLRAAQAQPRDHDPEATPQPTLPTNPLPQEPSISELTPQEPNVSEQTPVNQFLPSDTSEPSSTSTVTSFTPPSPIEHPLQTSSSFSSLTPQVQHPPLTVSITTNLASNDSKPTEYEKNTSSPIEHPLQRSSSSSTLFPAGHPPLTECVSTDLAPDSSKPTEYEKKQSRPIEHPPQPSPSPVSLSSAEHPLQTVFVSNDHADHDSKQTEYGKKLLSSIDEIERVVMKNLKRTPKLPPARKVTYKSTLMSLR